MRRAFVIATDPLAAAPKGSAAMRKAFVTATDRAEGEYRHA